MTTKEMYVAGFNWLGDLKVAPVTVRVTPKLLIAVDGSKGFQSLLGHRNHLPHDTPLLKDTEMLALKSLTDRLEAERTVLSEKIAEIDTKLDKVASRLQTL